MSQKFSERVNATPPLPIQLGSMSEGLKNSLWNFIDNIIDESPINSVVAIGIIFFKHPRHLIPKQFAHRSIEWLFQRYSSLEWHDVYNLLEFVAENCEALSKGKINRKAFEQAANNLLTREVSGYRFIQGILSPISSESEVEVVSEVITKASAVGLNGVRTHIETSMQLLGKMPDPDYRNSIKEAISAVESAVKSISGVEAGGLDTALKELMKRTEIHPCLRDGFLKLYGYSSDEDGIRHAIIDEAKVGFDEAKFMLVACSAASNFLIAKANEGGLLRK